MPKSLATSTTSSRPSTGFCCLCSLICRSTFRQCAIALVSVPLPSLVSGDTVVIPEGFFKGDWLFEPTIGVFATLSDKERSALLAWYGTGSSREQAATDYARRSGLGSVAQKTLLSQFSQSLHRAKQKVRGFWQELKHDAVEIAARGGGILSTQLSDVHTLASSHTAAASIGELTQPPDGSQVSLTKISIWC